jgi:adenylate cyclase
VTDAALAYLPADRRHAIGRGDELPVRCSGAALFADISGFTPLTEALVRAHGPTRGAEQLLIVLNRIYDALVAEVDALRGSVIVFSGDAITCWFDDIDVGGAWPNLDIPPAAPARAVACAFGLQRAMHAFRAVEVGESTVGLAAKVAVTTGAAVRMVVGDPSIQLIDTLAGRTVERLAHAEHVAEAGDVVVDDATVAALGASVRVATWRDGETGDRFAVVDHLDATIEPDPWPDLASGTIGPDVLRTWMIPPVADRLGHGEGEFLTELRPAVSLFLRFDGIDYDHDPDAPEHLDTFVRATQAVLQRFDTYILQVTIGDKGSYINTTFGAPVAHGDDAFRAITAALELRDLESPSIASIQIGITHGRTRAGACGSTSRRCYGVMGDPVNLSARLMQRARHRTALVEGSLRRAAGAPFEWLDLPPITVKGKTDPIAVSELIGPRRQVTSRIHRRTYALPLFGRELELRTITDTVDRTLRDGRGRIVTLEADAGLGKSRLVSETLLHAERAGMLTFGGECHSFGVNAGYHVWHAVWRAVFEVDPNASAALQRRHVERSLADIDPALAERAPLLGVAVNVAIPDNDLTASLDAALRKASLESLLVAVLRATVRARGPVLIVIEDAHWLDPLSHDLLEAIARAITDIPVVLVVAHRPATSGSASQPRISRLAHTTGIQLGALDDHDLGLLAAAKLRQVYGADAVTDPRLLGDIAARAQGNPFYIEELINYLEDRGVDPSDPAALARLELPGSLHSLILGRIDQLTEEQRSLVKVAAVIGRLFAVATLWGVHRPDSDRAAVVAELDRLSSQDLTTVDTPEPELAYLFKHVLTQEVAYETLSYATRAVLHEQIGGWIETHRAGFIEQHLDLLAHHYDRSENVPKRREYLRRAGEWAQAASANVSAADYFRRALPYLDGDERAAVLLRLGVVLDVLGEWADAEQADLDALALGESLGDTTVVANAARAVGILHRKRGDYPHAIEWLRRARHSFADAAALSGESQAVADLAEVERLQGRYDAARALYDESLTLAGRVADDHLRRVATAHALKGAGTVATWQGDYAAALRLNDESLALRRELDDRPGVAVMLNNQGIIARFQHRFDDAHRLNDEALARFREIGDRWSTGQLLNNQACIAADLGRHDEALELLDECLPLRRQLGDRAGLNLSLLTLADLLVDLGRFDDARVPLDESLTLSLELDDRTMLAYLVEDHAGMAAGSDPVHALRCAGFAAALRDHIGAPLPPNEQARVDRFLAPAIAALDAASAASARAEGAALVDTVDVATLLRTR